MKKNVAWVLLSLGLCVSVYAAEAVGVTAKAVPARATLGEDIRIFVSVERPRLYSVELDPKSLSLSPFEVKNVERSPVTQGKNRIRETFIITVTAFELGDLKVPPIPIRFVDAKSKPGVVRTDSLAVKIVSVGKKPWDKEDIRPIKGPISFSLARWRDFFFGLAAFILTAVLLVRIGLRLRKAMDFESRLPCDRRALLELERLRNRGDLEQKRLKEYYSGLSDILRRYFERRYGIQALELTTHELIPILKEKIDDRGVTDTVEKILDRCDLAKFAKYDPGYAEGQESENSLRDAVEKTKPVEEKVKS